MVPDSLVLRLVLRMQPGPSFYIVLVFHFIMKCDVSYRAISAVYVIWHMHVHTVTLMVGCMLGSMCPVNVRLSTVSQ